MRVQMIAQALEHRGLARSHLPGEQNKPLTALNAVNQVRQRFLVLGAPIQKRRIGAEVERIGDETEERLIHLRGEALSVS